MTDTPLIKKKHLFILFAIYLLFNLLLLMRTFRPGVAFDDIGPFFAAVRLAGLDWSGISSEVFYYGQVYYVFFAPLFVLIEDALIRHLVIMIINMCIISGVGVMMYYVAVKTFKLDNNFFTALIPPIITSITSYGYVFERVDGNNSLRATNEPAIFIFIWIVCFILIYMVRDVERSRRVALSLLLVLFLCYGLLLHTRLLGLVLAVSTAVLLFYIFFKRWIVIPYIFIPAMIIGYIGTIWAKGWLMTELWNGKAADELNNATLSSLAPSRIPSFKAAIDIVIDNLYAISVHTYGLATIALVLGIYLICKIISNIKKRGIQQYCKDIGVSEEQFLIYMVFGICIVGTILGYIPRFGRRVDLGIEMMQEPARMEYLRYFAVYLGPVLLVMYSYLQKHQDRAIKLTFTAGGVFLLISLYIWYFVSPYAGDRNIITWFFINDKGFNTTVTTVAVMIFLYALFLYINIGKHYTVLVFSILLILRLNVISWPFFNVRVPNSFTSNFYSVLNHIKQEAELPYKIHAQYFYRYGQHIQYYFSHNHIVIGAPGIDTYDNDEDSIFICDIDKAYYYIELYDNGFTPYILNNLTYWVRGDEMVDALNNSNNSAIPIIIADTAQLYDLYIE